MEIGIHFCPTAQTAPLRDVARRVESLGFRSFVVPEHTHIPLDSEFPGGGEVPERYREVFDPFVALAQVAACTELKIGTGVALIAQHDPIALAKATATLDYLSDGRLTLGVGYGWNRSELESHGRSFGARSAVVREMVGLMRSAWRDEHVEFDGRHVSLEPSWLGPSVRRAVGIPVLIGVPATEFGVREVANWADGWLPMCTQRGQLAGGLARVRDAWVRADRAGEPYVQVLDMGARDESLRGRLREYADLGVHSVIVDVPTWEQAAVFDELDRVAVHVEPFFERSV